MKKQDEVKSLPTTAQKTIPFDEIYENGMIKNRQDGKNKLPSYSMTFQVTNTDYLLLKDSDKQKKLNSYIAPLNALPDDITYQELLVNIPIETKDISQVMIPQIEDPTEREKAYIDIQKGFVKKIRDTQTDTKIYFTLSYAPTSKLDNPYQIIMQQYAKIASAYAELGVKTKPLTTEERLEIFHTIYNPGDIGFFTLPSDMYKRGTNIKDYIAPSLFNFKPTYIQMGDVLTRTFYVQGFSQILDDELIDDLLSNSFRLNLSKQIKLIDKSSAVSMVTKRMKALEADKQSRLQKNAKNNTTYIPYDLQKEIDACIELLDLLGNEEELFEIGIYFSVVAKDKEELESITKAVKGICQRHHVTVHPAAMRQEDALASIVPLAMDRMGLTTNLMSSGVAILLPFSYNRLFSAEGLYYGVNLMSKLPIIINRKENKNGNGFIFGQSGSGKSFVAKTEIEDVIHHTKNDRIMIIDPEAEFVPQCQAVGGTVINISADSKSYINPFDIRREHSQNEDVIKNKSDLIISIFEVIKNEKLLGTERSIIDRCVNLSYKDFIHSGWKEELLPTFKTFDEILQQQPDQEAKDLHLYLEMYVTGSVNIFAHHTNVDLNTRYIDFNLRDLGSNLKKVGMLILLDFIWLQTMDNFEKGIYTWLYADEFEMFYNDTEDNNSSGVFFEKVFARFRKYGGLATGITQNITNVLRSHTGLSMLQNAQFVELFEQAPKNLEAITDVYDLSERQAAMLQATERGHGLICMNNTVHPFEKVYPKNNLIYDSITTDFKDRINKLRSMNYAEKN